MELHDLSEEERTNVITDINKIMSEKYNICDKSIKNFWDVLMLGAEYKLYLCKHQNTDVDVMYR